MGTLVEILQRTRNYAKVTVEYFSYAIRYWMNFQSKRKLLQFVQILKGV